jgi:hypothetical protein
MPKWRHPMAEADMNTALCGVQRIVLGVVGAALLLFWSSLIDRTPLAPDATQNLMMSLSLAHHGVISLNEASRRPTMQREPLPIATGALAIRLVDAVHGTAPDAEYHGGGRLVALKYQNLLWLLLICGTLYAGARRAGLGFTASVLTVVASNLLLLDGWYQLCMVNNLLTESMAAALLGLGSLWLVDALESRGLGRAILAGACFGLLALAKAIFLYVALGLCVAAPLAVWLVARRAPLALWLRSLLIGVTAVLTALPWMLRNHAEFDTYSLAGRGGEALFDRAIMDQMTAAEYRGTFYAWSPPGVSGLVRRVLGYSLSDLEEGGRLQRLNESAQSAFAARDQAAEDAGRPDQTFTLYRTARAYRVAESDRLAALGDPNPLIRADEEVGRRAMAIFKAQPLRHLALTVPFMIRGGYFAFPALVAGFLWALWRRRTDLALLLTPALAMVLLYAVASSFEIRYAFPAYPLAMLGAAAFVFGWFGRNRPLMSAAPQP